MTCRLLVDVGNSRIKWALLSPEGLSLFTPFESDPQDLMASLDQAWGALSPPSAVALSNVRGEVVESLILSPRCQLPGVDDDRNAVLNSRSGI